MGPNRVVVAALAVLGVLAAVLPVAGAVDWSSTAGVLAGLGTCAAAGVTFLIGWQKHEGRQYDARWGADPATNPYAVELTPVQAAAAKDMPMPAESTADEYQEGGDPAPPELEDVMPVRDAATIPPDMGDKGEVFA